MSISGPEAKTHSLDFPCSAPLSRGEVRDIAPGIKWLRMPMPYALDHVNIYLIHVNSGWLIVDSGIDSENTRSIWDEIFSGHLKNEPIAGIYCTHYHVDHMGLAGYLTERFHIPLLTSFEEYFSLRGWPTGLEQVPWQHENFFRRAGFPQEQMEQTLAMFRFSNKLSPLPPSFIRLKDGGSLPMEGGDWRIMIGRGHSPEHALMLSKDLGILVSGDQLLPNISTNVSLSAVNPDDDPLNDWLVSLDRLEKLPDNMLVLPGHGLPFRGIQTRVTELRNHHERRFSTICEACTSQALSAYELVNVMYQIPLAEFDMQLALGECLAHLQYLLVRGHLTSTLDTSGVLRHSSTNARGPFVHQNC